MKTKNLYKAGLEINKVAKAYVQSLNVVVSNINELAKSDASVKSWFEECGISIRPKEKKNEKKDKVYLSADLIIKAWNKDLTIDGLPAYKVKGELRLKEKFSTFDVIKNCYRMYAEVALEAKRKEREAKKVKETKEVKATKEVKVAA
jgi:hypothetical protein